MSKHLVVVGGVAAGASAAAKARRTSEDIKITLIEAGPYISFANCGLPYYLGGEISDRDKLFVVKPEQFAKRFNIDLRTETMATTIDRQQKTITLTTLDGSETLSYDRLVLATGTVPVRPPIEGLDSDNIFTCRTVPDADAITQKISTSLGQEHGAVEAETVLDAPLGAIIIGGGYIGLETAEQFLHRGMSVTVVEMLDQIMGGAFDAEMALPVQKALEAAGATVLLGDGVAKIVKQDGGSVAVTRSGREIPFDIGILSVGVRPSIELAKQAGLQLGETGAIKVDQQQRTSDPDIFAAGDNSETIHKVLSRPVNIPLAGPANKAGRVAGHNAAMDLADISETDAGRLKMPPVLGTGIVRVCGKVAAVTGFSETAAKRAGLNFEVMYMPGTSHASYYPDAESLLLKILYAPDTGKLLGGQAVGGEGVDKRIDVLATAIFAGLSVEDLESLDLAYAPPFGSAKDPVIMAGFAAANARRETMPTITPQKLLDALAGDNGKKPLLVIDVRTPREFDKAHLPEAINVPVDEIRDRLDEIPADRTVAVHCGVGYRSYVAQQILINSGRQDVLNVIGGLGTITQIKESSEKD